MFENPLQYGALGLLAIVLVFLAKGSARIGGWIGARLDQQLHSNRRLQTQIVRSVRVTGQRVQAIGESIEKANGQTQAKLDRLLKNEN